VDTSLRDQFDRAVSGDPGIDPGEMAHTAIAEGGRIRRRRKQMAAAVGVVTVLATVAGLNLLPDAPKSQNPAVTLAAAQMLVAAPSCSPKPVDRNATDVIIFLATEATDRQRSALKSALDDDPRVDTLLFENREQAFQRFQAMWKDSPDFVAAVGPDQVPESFRLRLVDASQYTAFRGKYAAMDGVDDVIGRICPPSAPVGGTL